MWSYFLEKIFKLEFPVTVLTFNEWKKKVKKKFDDENIDKVVSVELNAIIKKCENEDALKDFEKLEAEGCTHLMAAMDKDGNIIGDIDFIREIKHDIKLSERHGSEGILVIER